jgi:hypothetical protein
MSATWFGQFAVAAFFAIVFLQSAADKWIDSKGNLDFLGGHFANSPLQRMVPAMFWAITVLESMAGILSAIGALVVLFGGGPGLVMWGLVFAMISLLCLLFGQRLAKDYSGAAVLATYFVVALVGIMLVS